MSSKHVFSLNVDFSQRELLNAALQNLFQAPLVPVKGQVYYDSLYNIAHYWNDNEWIPWERPVHKDYTSQSLMIADQELQLKKFIYYDGNEYWEYLGTTNGNISDYRLFGGGGEYIHPLYTPYDLTLTGATVIENIETDIIGSVVNLTVRQLELSDLGYTGNTGADYYGNWILNINGSEFYIVESENIVNIQSGDNITLNTSGNTLSISSQDTIYIHPAYSGVNVTLTGSTVISTIITDNIGSVVEVTTRNLTPQDIGAEPAFSKGNIVIPIDSGLSYTGSTTDRLVGTGDLTIINDDKGSDQNIFKEIRDISGNTVISAITNNDFIQIEGQSGTTVSFQSGNRVIISSAEQDNIVKIFEISYSEFDFEDPIIPQVVTYINNLSIPIEITQINSKLNIVIKNETIDEECEVILELINNGKGLYGSSNIQITESDLLIIEDNCNLCCDNFVRILYVPCEFVDFDLPLKPQIATYINQLDPPLIIENTDSKYNIIIDCEQSGTTVSCENGMDVLFLLDYTESMSTVITNIKNSISTISNNIVTKSGNNYRLGLILFDEYPLFSQPIYSGSTFYNELLINGDVYINNGNDSTQYITMITNFSENNIEEFETNITKILTDDFPLGNGNRSAEPYDLTLDVSINGTPFTGVTRTEFLKPFKNNVNKQIIIITDQLPSGEYDEYNQTVIDFINEPLKNSVLNNNIKINLLSTLLSPPPINVTGVSYKFDVFIFDGFNRNFKLSNRIFSKPNIRIGTSNTGLSELNFSVDYINNSIIIKDNVNLSNGIEIKIYYRTNAILNIVYDSNGLYITNYTSKDIIDTININCGNINPTIIYEIIGTGLGNTEISSCINYNLAQKIYTYCENINIGCILYYDDEGSQVVNNFSFISINDIVYQLNDFGEIISISSLNCNDIIDTYTFNGIGYANTSQDACDDAVSNNRIVYSDCEIITSGCTIYTDIYGLNPLTGFTNIFINEEIWDINNSTGILVSLSATQCSNPSIIYTQTNSGYGNTSQDACDDASLNNRTLYSDCSLITTGCTIYTDSNGNIELTGYTKVYVNGKVWDINNTNGIIISFSSTQCELPEYFEFTGSGYGNNSSTACNDAIINNRTLYSNCENIGFGCEIYLDINGTTPLTGYNNVFIEGGVWDLNLTNIIQAISVVQC
jgi:hypothetical protein